MKKIYVITAIILLMATLLTLVSCKEDTPDPSTDSSTESSTPIEDSSVEESLDISVDESSVEESSEDITSDIPEDSSEEESNPDESLPEESIPEESNPEESVPEESNPSEDVSEESIPSESSEEVSEEPDVSEEEPEECVHSYKETVVKATCKAGGYTLHKCEKCGEEYKTDKTEKGEHQFVAEEWCIEEYGCPVYYTCEGCGKSENRYDCGNPVHKQYKTCPMPEDHNALAHTEDRGCSLCGEHDCISFYTSERCPKYDPMKDDYVICQKCGKERGIGLGKCTTLLMDGNCVHCDAFIKAGECHECPYELKTEYYYFDANGGDLNGFPEMIEGVEGSGIEVSVVEKIDGSAPKYPMPVREGYAFVCWSKSKTMSAKDIDLELKIGHAAYLLTGPGTYYAIWVKE